MIDELDVRIIGEMSDNLKGWKFKQLVILKDLVELELTRRRIKHYLCKKVE